MRVISPPLPPSEQMPSRLTLRDGTTASIHVATRHDAVALRRFFHELSPESHRRRFFTLADPDPRLVDTFCDSSDPSRQVTLIATRFVNSELRPIAVGSYIDLGNHTAEAAFAVADAFQGKGLGTILLERLATLAASAGFRRFEAEVPPENAAMLEVFHESGYEIRSKSERRCITVLLSLNATTGSVVAAERRHAVATVASMRPLMQPAAVAVIGASRDPAQIGSRVLHAIV